MGVALGAHPLGDYARAEWDMKGAAAKMGLVRLVALWGDED